MIKYHYSILGRHYKDDLVEIHNNRAIVHFLEDLKEHENYLYINPELKEILNNKTYFPTGYFRVFNDFQEIKDQIEQDTRFGRYNYEKTESGAFIVTSKNEKREYGALINEFFQNHAFFKYKGVYFFLESLDVHTFWLE